MHPIRRSVLAVAIAACLPAAHAADAWPTRPITILVPAAAGGTTDVSARLIAPPLQRALGQPVIVDNRPGASGTLAAMAVADAKPDGYTLLMQYSGYETMTPAMTPNLKWDPIRSFEPVALVLSAPQLIAARRGLPVDSLTQLVAYAKANPGKVSYASSGNGSVQHVATELLQQLTGTKMLHVPYKGTGPALNDLLAGNVDLTITTPPPLVAHVQAGSLRALGVTSPKRLGALPNVPTAAEQGIKDYDISSWFALYAPAKTPPELVKRIAEEVRKIMATDEFQKKAQEQGAEALYMGPEELGAYTRKELARWAPVIRQANIRAD